MTLEEIAQNIDSAKIDKIRKLASNMGLKGAKVMGRSQLIDKIKRKSEYRRLVGDKDGEKVSSDDLLICPSCNSEREDKSNSSSTTCYNCGTDMVVKQKFIRQMRGGHNRGLDDGEENSTLETGYVYVLVSSAKPTLVKIGMTHREPEERAKELNTSTGVAMPYIVAYEAETPHPKEVESKVHERLSDRRVNPNREFFRVKLKRAIEIIEDVV